MSTARRTIFACFVIALALLPCGCDRGSAAQAPLDARVADIDDQVRGGRLVRHDAVSGVAGATAHGTDSRRRGS